MKTVHGFPFFPIEFTKAGEVFKPAQRKEILEQMPAGTTDAIIVSHGWNNDIADADSLYNALLKQVRAELPASLASRKFAVIGVFWPSKRFTDAELIPGGGASLGGGQSENEKLLDEIAALLKNDTLPATAKKATDPEITKAKKLVADVEAEDEEAAEKLIEIVRSRVAKDAPAPSKAEAKEDASDRYLKASPKVMLANLATPFDTEAESAPSGGGAAGGIGNVFKSINERVRDVLNFTTYYVMKRRAGDVGAKGVAPLIDDVRAKVQRVHLIGHSFGARVVTAAAAKAKKPVNSLTLLQAAFSHNAFGDDTKGLVGSFRSIVTGKRVSGAIVITHTRNDKAVGLAYPVASRLAGDQVAALGDANDVYGGLGSNGAQNAQALKTFSLTPAVKLDSLKFQAGKIYNLLSDTAIGGHSEITNAAVARAILGGISSGG